MNVKGIEVNEGSLELLKGLMEDKSRKVHGVFYTNSFFSQRYLCRSHVLNEKVNIEDNSIKLTVATRLEKTGLLEIENTLDMLVAHTAGDTPGYAPEGEQLTTPLIPEPVSVNQFLYSVDLVLDMKEPVVTCQDFTIAGYQFTLINLDHKLDEAGEFEQRVSILFGDTNKLYFLSHFYDKELSFTDMELILDLIMDENITGKAIVNVKMESSSGASCGIFPFDKLISSYLGAAGDYIFGATTGYIRIPKANMKDYKLTLVPNTQTGAYRLDLTSEKDTIRIYME